METMVCTVKEEEIRTERTSKYKIRTCLLENTGRDTLGLERGSKQRRHSLSDNYKGRNKSEWQKKASK